MSTTNPFFIRHQPGDTPGNNGGTFSACPDIIFSTAGPPTYAPPVSADPHSFLTAASYGTDYGSTVQVSAGGNVNNFVYLRALNTIPTTTVKPRLWMMFAQSDLALWPQNWRRDSIRVGQNYQNWQDGDLILSGGPGPYIVTSQPFLWSPTPPASGNHYCVISMVEPFPNADPAGSLSDPAFAPPSSVGYLKSFDQLVTFVLTNDWFGWRNTIDVSSLGATWQQTVPVTGPDDGGQVMVGVACNNMPTDGYVAAYMQGPDVQNSLNLPKSQITTPNMQLTVTLTLPPKYKTNMIITYWKGASDPPYQAKVVPFLGLPSAQVEVLLKGRRPNRAPRYVPVLDNVTNALLSWKRIHVFGSTPLSWGTPPAKPKGLVAVSGLLPTVEGSVKDAGATWQHSYPLEAPDDGGQFMLGYQCTDMPLGGRVAVDVVGPTDVALPPMAITDPNQQVCTRLQWPAKSKGTLTISYWQGVTPPPPGAKVEPLFVIVTPAIAAAKQDPPSWQTHVPVNGPGIAAQSLVGVQCTKMPTDGFIAMSLQPGDVAIPTTPISSSSLILAQPFAMPANYHGQMTIQYWAGATAPPLGANITPIIEIEAAPRA